SVRARATARAKRLGVGGAHRAGGQRRGIREEWIGVDSNDPDGRVGHPEWPGNQDIVGRVRAQVGRGVKGAGGAGNRRGTAAIGAGGPTAWIAGREVVLCAVPVTAGIKIIEE